MNKKSVENSILNETTINGEEKNVEVTNESTKDNKLLLEKKKKKQIVNMLKILFCKTSNETKGYTDKTFAALTSLILRIFGYSLLVIDLLFFVGAPIHFIYSYDWSNILEGVLNIIYIVAIMIFNFLMAVLLVGTAKEQEGNDYNTTIPVFSAIVSFIALIISLVALIK